MAILDIPCFLLLSFCIVDLEFLGSQGQGPVPLTLALDPLTLFSKNLEAKWNYNGSNGIFVIS